MTRWLAAQAATVCWMALAVGAAMALAGCNSACADLADRSCQKAGEADPTCQRLRAVAAQPTEQDLKACRAGHAFIDEMERR